MKPITCLVAATVALVFAAVSARARVDCADWNTQEFFKAAKASDVTRCLEVGADPGEGDLGDQSPLHTAALVGSAAVVTALVEAGADPNARNKFGGTPLHQAAHRGNGEAVRSLLEAGADPNVRDEFGGYPLHIMLGHGDVKAVVALLKAGADPNVKNKYGSTPLHSAVYWGSAKAVRALLKAGADPAARDEYGNTPLQVAADCERRQEASKHSLKVVRALLEAGTDPAAWAAAVSSIAAPDPAQLACPDWNTAAFFKAARESDVTRCLEAGAGLEERSRSGKTPLRLAAEAGNVEALTTLAKVGANLQMQNTAGETVLHAVAANGTAETVKALLQAGADPKATTARGATPLGLFAAGNKDPGTLRALLEAGADLNAPDPRTGSTPLHTAAAVGTAEGVKVLLEAGANPNALDRNRKTPWDRARGREALKGSDVYRRLASATSAHPQLDCAGWNTIAFFEAAESSEVARCLEAGADLNARSAGGWTPLHVATVYNPPAVVKVLLDAGADPNARSGDGRAPLHMAVGYNKDKKKDHHRDAEVATILLNSGADPNVRSSGGWTPLHTAASGGGLSVISDLLGAGADLEARTEDGRTPLHFAAHNMYSNAPEVVAELLNFGADLEARNKDGKTPWDLAQRNRNLKNTGAVRRLESGAEGTIRIGLAPPKPPVQLGMAPEPTAARAQVDCANWNTAAFFKAARESDVTRCLEAGANPNVGDRSGFAPLHIVASVGNVGAVAALVNRGADLGAWAGNGETPLHIAAAVENPGVVAALANQGANLEARDATGLTALHRAAARRSDRGVRALLKAGADPDARNEYRQTALHFAATIGSSGAVRALLEAGADPDARDITGETPLNNADNEAVRALLEAAGAGADPALGADLETRDGRGETRLYQAVINGTTEAVTALLRAGANPNARNVVCMTPLHYAAALWRPGAGMALLTAGADPALRDKDGEFPFDEIPAGIGDILRLQAKGLFPPGGQIGGPQQTHFYSKLYQGKFSQVRRRFSPNPIPPECSESGDLRSIPSAQRRNRARRVRRLPERSKAATTPTRGQGRRPIKTKPPLQAHQELPGPDREGVPRTSSRPPPAPGPNSPTPLRRLTSARS